MAYIPASNVLKLEVRGTLNGEEVENVLYFQHSGAITTGDVEDLFDFFEDTWIPEAQPERGTLMLWDELYATDLTTETSPTWGRSFSPAIAGTGGSPTLPGNNALCISFRSGNRGRSGRGRNYVPGMQESQATGNLWGTSNVNAAVALYELLLGGGDFPAAWIWVVLSLFNGGAPRVSGLAQTVLDVLSTSLTVDSQRKRLIG